MSGDGNIEDLFGIFPSTDADAGDVWGTCIHFVEHLHWHKPRKTALIPKNHWRHSRRPSHKAKMPALPLVVVKVPESKIARNEYHPFLMPPCLREGGG